LREEEMNATTFINTPLPRGARTDGGRQNRFNGFSRPTKTVETVSIHPPPLNTPLKQGVNEPGASTL
jgi:hypothetical protein